ncbi:MAG: hypothetical protein ACK4IX_01835 [Candidatus Sericytochromatia bacterium]
MKKYLILLTVFIFSCQSNLNQNTSVVNNNEQNKTTNGTGVDSVINKLIDKASNDQVDYNGEDKEFRSDFNVSSSDKKIFFPLMSIISPGSLFFPRVIFIPLTIFLKTNL